MAPTALRQDAAFPVGEAAAAAVAWRYRGELRVSAIVKATFAFAPGAAMTRVAPEPIAVADSARGPSDLAPYLRRADIVLTGAPRLPAGAEVGLAIAAGAQPLLDKTTTADVEGSLALGPVPRAAPLPAMGLHVTEIPASFDVELFQAAPADQRTDYPRGDEWIMIEGLYPGRAELRTRLPGARAHARVYGLSAWRLAEGKALGMNADLLHLRADEERCTVTWRGTFALPDEAALGSVRLVVGVELPGAPIAWPERAEALGAPQATSRREGTLPLPESALLPASRDATLPIPEAVAGPAGQAPAKAWTLDALLKSVAEHRPAGPPAPAPPIAAGRAGHDQTLAIPGDPSSAAKAPVLPFVQGTGAPPAIASADPAPRPRARRVGDETLAIPDGAPRPATLPFDKPGGKAASEPPPPVEAPAAASAPKPPPAKEFVVSSPADAPPAAKKPAPAKAPEKKLPPKVDVAGKLYGKKR